MPEALPEVLMVAWYFPPLGGAGVQRTLKYVKYLPALGWQPLVLTGPADRAVLSDPSLLAEIPLGIRVERSPAWLLPRGLPYRLRSLLRGWLLVVDEQVGWLPFAVAAGKRLIHAKRPHLLYTTSAPYTGHLAGLQLHKASGLPWIADFRDPWIGNFSASYPTRLHQSVHARLEERVVRTAQRVIVVSEPMRAALLGRYAWLSPHKVITIPNGFDAADFTPTLQPMKANEAFTITYTGSFYQNGLTAHAFLTALKLGLQTGRLAQENVCVELVGNIGKETQRQIASLGLGGVVNVRGYLQHSESIRYLQQADMLLLVIGSTPGSETVFTGKIFEYLAARKPILGLAPQGPAADLIRQAHAGVVIPPDDPSAICENLVSAYQRWQSGTLAIQPDLAVIAQYERQALTARLAAEMDHLHSQSGAGL